MKEERVYCHDGSFAAFLCACAELLNEQQNGHTARVQGPDADTDLFSEYISVHKDSERAASLWERLKKKAGAPALMRIFEAFNSDIQNIDRSCAIVLSNLWQYGPTILEKLSDEAVWLVLSAATRTRKELHLFHGITRFKECTDGSLYGCIHPHCDILPLAGAHFSARWPARNWILHDGRRNTALLHQANSPHQYIESFHVDSAAISFSKAEASFNQLWERYTHDIAITERKNRKLQRSYYGSHADEFLLGSS